MSRRQSDFVHLENCVLIRKTDKAVLVKWDGSQYWFPFSQLADGEEEKIDKVKADGREPFTLSVTEWIAAEKGIDAE